MFFLNVPLNLVRTFLTAVEKAADVVYHFGQIERSLASTEVIAHNIINNVFTALLILLYAASSVVFILILMPILLKAGPGL